MARHLDSQCASSRAASSVRPGSGAPSSEGPWGGLSADFVRERAACRLRVLGHPARLRIVEVLARSPANVGDVADAADLTPSVTSRHLRELHGAGLVDRSQGGNFVLYALADRDVARLVAVAYRGAVTDVRRVLALDSSTPDQARSTTREPGS